MAIEVKLPEISENVTTGDVIKVLVAVGDTVSVDQPLVELETEKAVFEVPSTAAGVVKEILVKAGDTINVGDVIVRIESAGAQKAEKAPAPPKKETTAAPKPEAAAPKPEAEEKKPEPAPTPPPRAGDDADVDRTVVAVAEEVREAKRRADEPPPASPTVRRLARELGIDIHVVPGSGAGGRITADDVQRFAKSMIARAEKGAPAAGAASAAPVPAAGPLPDFSRFGPVERVAMSKVRAVTARNMAVAWNTVPHVTQHDEADVTELEDARKRYGKMADDAGGKLTMTAILLKVCASALRRFPELNASVDAAAQEIVYKKYVNIGVAVDTERGLLVPVVKDADRKNVLALSVELAQLAEKARTKKITPDQLEGGNFTVSNLGGIGGTGFTPIVYHPEVAILGVSRAAMRPVWNDDEFVPRMIMPLSLSYDHRLIDGAQAARCLRWICTALEDPILLSIDG